MSQSLVDTKGLSNKAEQNFGSCRTQNVVRQPRQSICCRNQKKNCKLGSQFTRGTKITRSHTRTQTHTHTHSLSVLSLLLISVIHQKLECMNTIGRERERVKSNRMSVVSSVLCLSVLKHSSLYICKQQKRGKRKACKLADKKNKACLGSHTRKRTAKKKYQKKFHIKFSQISNFLNFAKNGQKRKI